MEPGATVLLAYASPHGSTRSIAERIAAGLRRHGLGTACVPVTDEPDVTAYDAVVVGSAVHDTAWLPEAAEFVTGRTADLAVRPVWLFSVGMVDALPRRARRMAAREGDTVVEPYLDRVHPRDTRLFSGVVSRGQFPRMSRALLRLAGARYGDYRDWAAVDAWADLIADELTRGS